MAGAKAWDEILRDKGIGVHVAATAFRILSDKELDELAASIEKNGLRIALRLWRASEGDSWQLIDGRNRVAAMARRPDGDVMIAGAIALAEHYTGGDPIVLARDLNQERRHDSLDDRRKAAETLLRMDPTRSDRSIAKEAGISPSTMGAIRTETQPPVQNGQWPEKRVGRDGKARKQPTAKPTAAAARVEARETGKPVVARDGKIYSGKTIEQERAEVANTKIVFQLINALTNLGTMPVAPAEYMKVIPTSKSAGRYMDGAINKHFSDAKRWFADFCIAWERHLAETPIGEPVEPAAEQEAGAQAKPAEAPVPPAASPQPTSPAPSPAAAAAPVVGVKWERCNKRDQRCGYPDCGRQGKCLQQPVTVH